MEQPFPPHRARYPHVHKRLPKWAWGGSCVSTICFWIWHGQWAPWIMRDSSLASPSWLHNSRGSNFLSWLSEVPKHRLFSVALQANFKNASKFHCIERIILASMSLFYSAPDSFSELVMSRKGHPASRQKRRRTSPLIMNQVFFWREPLFSF